MPSWPIFAERKDKMKSDELFDKMCLPGRLRDRVRFLLELMVGTRRVGDTGIWLIRLEYQKPKQGEYFALGISGKELRFYRVVDDGPSLDQVVGYDAIAIVATLRQEVAKLFGPTIAACVHAAVLT